MQQANKLEGVCGQKSVLSKGVWLSLWLSWRTSRGVASVCVVGNEDVGRGGDDIGRPGVLETLVPTDRYIFLSDDLGS